MDRVSQGFRLMRLSWSVLRDTPSLLGVVAAGVVGHALVSLSLTYLVLGRLPGEDDLVWPRYLVVLPMIWAGSYVSVFCNAVVVATAHARLEDPSATTLDGFWLAAARLPQLVAWTTVSIVVGTVLHLVAERLKLAGPIVRWLVGMAWSLATVFVVPVLVVEGGTTRGSIRRSARLFRRRWGETATAEGGFGIVLLAVGLAFCPFVGLLAIVSVPLAIAVGIVVLAALIVLSNAFDGVLTASLYRYAVDGRVSGPFDEADLEDRFVSGG
jgi:hypothetical protein